MNFNKAFILGRLTRDPEQRALPSGQSVVNFSLATSRFYKDNSGAKQSSTDYHNIVAFGKLGEISARYLKKGSLVFVEGRIQTRSWQDKDNNKRSKTEIVMESMQLGPKSSSSGFNQPTPSSPHQKPAPVEDIPIIDQEEPVSEEQEDINVDNIPF